MNSAVGRISAAMNWRRSCTDAHDLSHARISFQLGNPALTYIRDSCPGIHPDRYGANLLARPKCNAWVVDPREGVGARFPRDTTMTIPATRSEPGTSHAGARQYLQELPSGSRAVVQQIDGRDEALRRLMAMGLCVGREIEVVRQGNPLIIRLLGARIGVSGRLVRRVVVERVP